MTRQKFSRYAAAAALVASMVAAAELFGEREAIFPEAAALAAGLWVVDKRVWNVRRSQALWLMTAGAAAGICIVRYSPLPLPGNVALAFLFAAGCLTATGTTLYPLISAVMLPVVLGARSVVYPVAVCMLLLVLTAGQRGMELRDLRREIRFRPRPRNLGREALKWTKLLVVVLLFSALPLHTGYTYCFLPPLIVAFVELSRPEAGLRRAPGLIFGLLAAAAAIGAGVQYGLHVVLGLPSCVAALAICVLLFALFETAGRIFAPAAAVALIPLLIPESDLMTYPLQAALGSALFIAAALVVFRRPAGGRSSIPAASGENR